jgi:hypothetical protein
MTADFNYILPLIILIGVIASLIDKARKASDEAKRRSNLPPPIPRPRVDLPEATRRQIYGSGETTVRRAKPLVMGMPAPEETEGRNDSGEGRNDEDWGKPAWTPPPTRPQPRPQPVSPTPASTPWGELRRQLEQGARNIEQEVRRQMDEAQRRSGQQRPLTEFERQEQLRQQRREQEAARARQAGPRRQAPAPAPQQQQPQRPAPPPPPQRRAPRPRRRPHPLLGDSGDIRRAIVLREVLGPPRGLE